MKLRILIVLFTFYTLNAIAQHPMKTAEELINESDPGWPFVKEWITTAKNKVEVLPSDSAKAKTALYQTQVTTRSPMGAIIYMTGGILVDDGWIRILGSGHAKLDRSLPDWNKGKSFKDYGEAPGFFLIADDAIGGFFILNGGAIGEDLGKVYYFAPDNLEFESLDMTYTEFLQFCFNGDLETFYKGFRWKTWRTDVLELTGDKGFGFYPFLWTKEGKDIENNSRKAVPVEEQYQLSIKMRKELGIEKGPSTK